MRAPLTILLVAFALLRVPTASACPDCPAARAAREEALDRDLGRNLFTALAPFLVVGAVAASIYRSGRRDPPGASGPAGAPRPSA